MKRMKMSTESMIEKSIELIIDDYETDDCKEKFNSSLRLGAPKLFLLFLIFGWLT